MQNPAIRALLAAVVLTLLGAACNPTPGEGFFDAGWLDYEGCDDDDLLPWEPGFYTIDNFENTATIRFQDVGGGIEAVDGIFIQVDRGYVGKNLGQTINLGTPTDGEIRATAIMGFYRTCPLSRVTPEFIGTIRFGRWSIDDGDQIDGEFDAPLIINRRDGREIGGDAVGEFSFLVQKGRPYTNFTGPSAERSPFQK